MGARAIVHLCYCVLTHVARSQILACVRRKQPIALRGMTGLVSAAAPLEGEIALSLERMKSVIEVDPVTATMTVEAGVELQTIQEQAEAHGLLFPLDLGARGSCTIGGNLSTNAGGNRVIRYGMTRDLVIGVEAVDGTVADGLHKLRKNNTGMTCIVHRQRGDAGRDYPGCSKLSAKPSSQSVALCGVRNFSEVSRLLCIQPELGANLSAYEVIWNNAYRSLTKRSITSLSLCLWNILLRADRKHG